MGEKIPVTIAPLKIVSSFIRQTGVIGGLGLASGTTYVQTPHLYVVDSTDILSSPEPSYIGESKKTMWLTGWVCLDVLSEKYPEDQFIQRCLDPKLRFEEGSKAIFELEGEKTILRQKIAEFMPVRVGHEAIHVRIVTPAKIKYRWKGWRARPRFEPYIAPV